jgi:hypothetical protein
MPRPLPDLPDDDLILITSGAKNALRRPDSAPPDRLMRHYLVLASYYLSVPDKFTVLRRRISLLLFVDIFVATHARRLQKTFRDIIADCAILSAIPPQLRHTAATFQCSPSPLEYAGFADGTGHRRASPQMHAILNDLGLRSFRLIFHAGSVTSAIGA